MRSMIQFLIDRFPNLLDVNCTASIVILFVICARQLLKGAPKIFSYALWGIVLLRLLVPISVESPMSFVPERTEFSGTVDVNEALPEVRLESPQGRADNPRESAPPGESPVPAGRSLDAQTYLTLAWLAGIVVMLSRGAVSYRRLRKRVRVALPFRKGVYLADDVDTPFVMGFLRPKIYLPGTLEPSEREYIIAHERHHIRRGDHIFKALGFLALTIHWFNPLVWAAFILAGRDMEMSCDEAVIRKLGEDVRAEYSASLLKLATGQRLFTGTPLAFGEGDPAGRVRNLAKWKKPAFWVILFCVIVCVVLAVCLLTDPETPFPTEFQQYFVSGEKEELLSGTTGEISPKLFITFKESSGPQSLTLELWYRRDGEDSWLMEEEFAISPQDTCTFTIPLDSAFAVAATADGGKNGYATVALSAGQGIVFDEFPRDPLTSSNTKSTREDASAWTVPTEATAPNQAEEIRAVTVAAHEVTPESLVLTYHNAGNDPYYRLPGYSVQVWQDGEWAELDVGKTWNETTEEVDFNHQSQPENGMYIQWDGIGTLPEGQYRIGQEFCTQSNLTRGQRFTVYASFEINGDPEKIKALEELPALYSGEQAMLDGCLVTRDGEISDNLAVLKAFVETTSRGEPGFMRIVNWHYGEGSYYTAEDLTFDGSQYTLEWLEDGRRQSGSYRYLKQFTGEKERENMAYDAYEHYVLVDDSAVTWEQIFDGLVSSQAGAAVNCRIIASDYIYYTKHPDLPDKPDYALLEFAGDGLVTVTDSERLESLRLLFENGELLGYEPKTHSIGVGLNLIFASGGEDFVIELDPDSDICRVNGEYVSYGAPDEPDYIYKLWETLGITQWPDIVYTVCENALRP